MSSKEIWNHLQGPVGVVVGFITILAAYTGLVIHVGGKAPHADLTAVKESIPKAISTAIVAHEAKNAHHGVAAMIARYAPSRIDFALLRQRVTAMGRQTAESRREIRQTLREIKRALQDVQRRLPRRRYQHYGGQSKP